MKLHRLKLENYRRHSSTEIEFGDGLTALVGQNGSGKSTILEAIGFALFGAAATRTGKELLRNEDAAHSDAVAVELSFTLADSAYEVRRELRGKNLTPSATVIVNGTPVVAPGSGSDGAATAELQRRIGMDRDAFFTTVVARQKELNKLAELGPVDRKRMLLRMLNVDAVDGAINMARGKRRNSETYLEGLRAGARDLVALQAELVASDKKLENLLKNKENANSEWVGRKASHKSAEKAWQELNKHQNQFEKTKQELQLLQEQLRHAGIAANDAQQQWLEARQAAGKLATLEGARAAWENAQASQKYVDERARLEGELAKLQKSLKPLHSPPEPAFYEAAKEALEITQSEQSIARTLVLQGKKKLAELTADLADVTRLGPDAPCPTCKRPMETHLPTLIAELESSIEKEVNQVAEAEASFARLQAEQIPAKIEVTRLDAEAREAEKSKALQEQLRLQQLRICDALDALPSVADDWPEKFRAAKTNHENWLHWNALATGAEKRQLRAEETAEFLAQTREALEKLEAAPVPDKSAKESVAKGVLETAKSAERNAERGALGADAEAKLAEVESQAVAARIADGKAHAEKITTSEEEARYWAALAGARGGGLLDAFKDHLVGRIGPAVSAEASRLIAQFTDGRYTEIVLDADYQITVADQGIPYPLERFSGGESDLVHLALRLAVSRLIAERSGADLQFLALDEVFGSLDEDRKHSVLAALHSLRGLYAQVLLVTHQDGLREGLDSTLVVQEVDGVVSVHNG